jgi:hypothetical protein
VIRPVRIRCIGRAGRQGGREAKGGRQQEMECQDGWRPERPREVNLTPPDSTKTRRSLGSASSTEDTIHTEKHYPFLHSVLSQSVAHRMHVDLRRQ